MTNNTNNIDNINEGKEMADWLKVETRSVANPKIARLAIRLKEEYAHMWGHLNLMWLHAKSNNEDGNVTKWTMEDFVFFTQWTGDGKELLKALRELNFVEKRGEFWLLHDCLSYAGDHLKAKYRRGRPEELKRIWEMHGRVFGEEHNEVVADSQQPRPQVDNAKFEEVWNLYPSRTGRKSAERHFRATVKTDEDVENIKKALSNYLKSGNVTRGFVKNGSTWFNEWQDWTKPTETMMKGSTSGTEKRNYNFDQSKYPTASKVKALSA